MVDIEKRTILINPNERKIDRMSNLLAKIPREEAEMTVTEEFPTGLRRTTTQKNLSQAEKVKKELEKKEEANKIWV